MEIRNRFSPQKRVQVVCGGEGKSRAKQSFKKDCDINVIMGRYLKSGNIDHLAKHGGSYGFASVLTFHEAMNVVRKAEEMFLDLSSELRRKFHNDPAVFLEFVQNPVNLPEMRKLGLAKAEVREIIQKVEVVAGAAPGASGGAASSPASSPPPRSPAAAGGPTQSAT